LDWMAFYYQGSNETCPGRVDDDSNGRKGVLRPDHPKTVSTESYLIAVCYKQMG